LFKVKEDENVNRMMTLSISRINPPKFYGGLKFDSNTGMGKKGAFIIGLEILVAMPFFFQGVPLISEIGSYRCVAEKEQPHNCP
jgi:hypothetical protein